jgi:hypothetical protein
MPMHGWTLMSIDPVHSSPFAVPAQPGGGPAAAPADASAFAKALDGAQASRPAVPEEPTTEAMEAVRVAGDVYEQLRAADRELHFSRTAHGVRIDVYDGEGQLVQRVPATEVMKLASGEKTWLA